MGWLLAGGFLGLAVRAIFWVIVWNIIGENWHWSIHAISAWLIGDLVASIVMNIFGSVFRR